MYYLDIIKYYTKEENFVTCHSNSFWFFVIEITVVFVALLSLNMLMINKTK